MIATQMSHPEEETRGERDERRRWRGRREEGRSGPDANDSLGKVITNILCWRRF